MLNFAKTGQTNIKLESAWLPERPCISQKTVSASPHFEILQALPIHDIAFDIQSVLLSCIIGSWSYKCDQINLIFDLNEAPLKRNTTTEWTFFPCHVWLRAEEPSLLAEVSKLPLSHRLSRNIIVKQLEESFSLTFQFQQNKITILWKWADTFIWWSEFRVKRMFCKTVKTSVSRRFNEDCSQHAVFLDAHIYSFLLRSCSFGRDSLC